MANGRHSEQARMVWHVYKKPCVLRCLLHSMVKTMAIFPLKQCDCSWYKSCMTSYILYYHICSRVWVLYFGIYSQAGYLSSTVFTVLGTAPCGTPAFWDNKQGPLLGRPSKQMQQKRRTVPSRPRTYYSGTGALKGPFRACCLGT